MVNELAGEFVFDPLDESVRREPYQLYARARQECPVYRHANLPLVSVFTYADIVSVFENPVTWSSDFAALVQPYLLARPELKDEMPPFFAMSDGVRHDSQRELILKAFTPRMMRNFEPTIEAIAAELLDLVLEQREVDLMPTMFHILPLRVIGSLLGIPREDADQFDVWARDLVENQVQGVLRTPSNETIEKQVSATRGLHGYFRRAIAERRSNPREDLISGLAAVDERTLSEPDLLQMLTMIMISGFATTVGLLANAIVDLLRHPDQLAQLRSELHLVPTAINEVLRFSTPVQAMPRICKAAAEIRGIAVRPGEFVLNWLGSANRDDTVFERADRFDISRAPNPHIAFGFGPHSCVGSYLAVREGVIVLRMLLERTRGFELATDAPLPLVSSFVARSYRALPMRLSPA